MLLTVHKNTHNRCFIFVRDPLPHKIQASKFNLLRAGQQRNQGWFPAEARYFAFLHSIQTPSLLSNGTGVYFPKGNVTGT